MKWIEVEAYDPRDANQLPDDPASWAKTDNPALICAHFMPMWIKELWGFWDRTRARADYCDEMVPLADRARSREVDLIDAPDDATGEK